MRASRSPSADNSRSATRFNSSIDDFIGSRSHTESGKKFSSTL